MDNVIHSFIHSLNNPGKALLLGMLALFETFQSCMSVFYYSVSKYMYSKRANKVYFKFTMTHWKLSTAITQTQLTHCAMIFETNSVLVQKNIFLSEVFCNTGSGYACRCRPNDMHTSYWLLTLKNTCTCRCTYFFVDWANTCSWQQRTFVTTIKSTSIYNTNQLRL